MKTFGDSTGRFDLKSVSGDDRRLSSEAEHAQNS